MVVIYQHNIMCYHHAIELYAILVLYIGSLPIQCSLVSTQIPSTGTQHKQYSPVITQIHSTGTKHKQYSLDTKLVPRIYTI